jgi:hypothetical protein
MNIEDLTIGQLREIAKMIGAVPDQGGHWRVGSNYFIRTVTHHLMGKLEAVHQQELVMSSVSWIADDGRFNELLEKGKPTSSTEVEPAPEGQVIIGRGSLIDAYLWPHALLRSVK